MTLAVAVTAHTSRLAAAEQLCDNLGARMFLDNGTLGEPGNTRAALRWLEQSGADHGLVIQDDALPVGDFLQRARAAIDERSGDIISYYLGTGRPAQKEAAKAIHHAELNGEHWVNLQRLYWGVAWSIPIPLLPVLNKWLRICHNPTDTAVGQWAKATRTPCSYVWPCIVDHQDGPTLIHSKSPSARRAWKMAG